MDGAGASCRFGAGTLCLIAPGGPHVTHHSQRHPGLRFRRHLQFRGLRLGGLCLWLAGDELARLNWSPRHDHRLGRASQHLQHLLQYRDQTGALVPRG